MTAVSFAPLRRCPGRDGVGCGSLIDPRLAACFECKKLPAGNKPRDKDARRGGPERVTAMEKRSSPEAKTDLRSPGVTTSTNTDTQRSTS